MPGLRQERLVEEETVSSLAQNRWHAISKASFVRTTTDCLRTGASPWPVESTVADGCDGEGTVGRDLVLE
jgi:hypothetical protein